MTAENLESLCNTWERRAARKLFDAEHESNPMGKRLIEHGAICYFNCAQELKNAIAEVTARSQVV